MTKRHRMCCKTITNRTVVWTTFILLMICGAGLLQTPQSAKAAADPATTAVDISVLEAQGRFSDIYDHMHPDAQAFIPRAAVVGWYENDFAPLGPGVITVTGVQYVTWTWPVTGKTYANTAEVAFQQPFANGGMVTEVVRLVESGGNWRWFFGRSPEFVNEQIVKYGHTAVSPSGSAGACDGAAEWWKTTMPSIVAADYLAYTMLTLIGNDGAAQALLNDYAASFAQLRAYQAGLTSAGAGMTVQADFVELLDLYEGIGSNTAALLSGMNPLAERGAQSAIVQAGDRIGNIRMSFDGEVSTFLNTCEPLVVFVHGMGEDLPIGVLPGEVGPNVPMLDCSMIVDQVDPQRFFEAAGAGDPHRLDSDRDGVACG